MQLNSSMDFQSKSSMDFQSNNSMNFQVNSFEKTIRDTKRYDHDEFEGKTAKEKQRKQREKQIAEQRKLKKGE